MTGESLLQGYARLGKWAVRLLLAALIIHRHTSNLYLVMMLGSAADLVVHLPMPHSSTIWSLAFVALAFVILFWGRYATVEILFKFMAAVLSLTFAAAAVLSKPDLGAAVAAIVAPRLPDSTGAHSVFFVLMALIGSGSGSLNNVTYSYFIHRRGWRGVSFLNKQRADLLSGVTCMFVLGALVQLAAAGTLGSARTPMKSLEDLAGALTLVGGYLGVFLFGVGLWAVTLSVFVGASTGFALIVTDASRNLDLGLDVVRRIPGAQPGGSPEKDPIYKACILFSVLSPLYILFTPADPVWLVLFAGSVTLALVPLMAIGLMRLTNDRRRLGNHANGWMTNLLLAVLVATSLLLSSKTCSVIRNVARVNRLRKSGRAW